MAGNEIAEPDALKVIYEARRTARGGEGDVKRVPLRRKVLRITLVSLLVVGVAIGVFWWWVTGRVAAERATLRAAVTSLSPDIDGRLKEILVRPGDKVEKGQALLRLDDTELRAALTAGEAQLAISESQYSQAKAARDRAEANMKAGIELAEARLAIAAARVTGSKAVLDRRKAQIGAQVRRAEAQRDEAKARLVVLKRGPRPEEIEVARLRVATAKAMVEFYTLDVEQIQKLVDKGFDSTFSVESKRLELTSYQNKLREAEVTLARLKAGPDAEELEAATQALAAREAALDLVQAGRKDIAVLTADVATMEAAHLEAKAELKLAKARSREVQLLEEQVRAAQAEFKRAEADVAGRRAALKRALVECPVAGTIIRTFGEVGEFCSRGRAVVLVADDSRGRWVEAFVDERKAARVREGQHALVDIIDGSGDYVEVDAVVEAVGLCTTSLSEFDEPAAGAASSARQVWVKLRPKLKDDSLRPGTSARAVIHVR